MNKKFIFFFICLLWFIPELRSQQTYTSGKTTLEFQVFSVEQINTNGLDFCPVVTGNKLVFVSEREIDYVNYGENRFDNEAYLTIQVSQMEKIKDTVQYSKTKLLSNRISTLEHSGPITFSADGNYTVFSRVKFYKIGRKRKKIPQLYSAEKENGTWKNTKLLSFNSSDYSLGHPSLSSNGQYLYFAAEMPNGQGGKDIYVTKREGESWGIPQNLGPDVNSPKNEVFPFIYRDTILFFSSDGYRGLGGLDVFMTSKDSDEWENIVHLDANINSKDDDFGLFLFGSDSTQGYFSSNREGGLGKDDIYRVRVKWTGPEILKSIAGRFKFETLPYEDKTGLKIFLVNDRGVIIDSAFTDKKGNFVFTNLPYDENFILKIAEQSSNLHLILLDSNNEQIAELSNNPKGEFIYKELSYNRFKGTSFLYEVDTVGLIEEDFTKSVSGQFNFQTLPGKGASGLKVLLISDDGELIYTAFTDDYGNFNFENLPYDKNFTIKTEEYIPGMELLVFNNDKLVAKLASNAEGKFIYVKLSYKSINQLAMMDAGEANTLMKDNFIDLLRGMGKSDIDDRKVTVFSLDKSSAFVFDVIEKKQSGNLSLMQGTNVGLCPETTNLTLEEQDECLDISIEELLSEAEDLIGFQQKTKRKFTSDTIYFDYNSYALTKDTKKILDYFINMFGGNAALKMEIKAYADLRGTVKYNLNLSQQRAESVLDHVFSKGVQKSKLSAIGMGVADPGNDCADCTEEQFRLQRKAVLRVY